MTEFDLIEETRAAQFKLDAERGASVAGEAPEFIDDAQELSRAPIGDPQSASAALRALVAGAGSEQFATSVSGSLENPDGTEVSFTQAGGGSTQTRELEQDTEPGFSDAVGAIGDVFGAARTAIQTAGEATGAVVTTAIDAAGGVAASFSQLAQDAKVQFVVFSVLLVFVTAYANRR